MPKGGRWVVSRGAVRRGNVRALWVRRAKKVEGMMKGIRRVSDYTRRVGLRLTGLGKGVRMPKGKGIPKPRRAAT